ncbi:hypothetical protein [Curtobacterium flaccumfaciens]|uniref:hypothetical protein n=1 Tax=Curtobacterium flaccumfaciens TaxID=2035 RepID=UPI003992387C
MGWSTEYDNLAGDWINLASALPPVDGFRLIVGLPDIAAIGRSFIDYADIGVMPLALYEEMEEPQKQIDEYRYRLTHARTTRSRLA